MPLSTTPRTATVEVADGVSLALDRWGAPPGGPDGGSNRAVLFLYATGFTRGVWRAHARRLLDVCAPFAVDLRGHGASSRPAAPYRWPLLVDDITALVEREGWTDMVMCGHSVGGSTAVEVATRLPEVVSALVLAEAPLSPPAANGATGGPSALVGITEKRRNHWSTRTEGAAYLRERAPYDSWDAEVYAGWTKAGFMGIVDGVELSCPPWVEASVFRESHSSRAWERLPELRCPVWVLRATGEQGMRSTTAPETAGRIPGAREVVVEGSGHFLPLERPALVAEVVREALRVTAR